MLLFSEDKTENRDVTKKTKTIANLYINKCPKLVRQSFLFILKLFSIYGIFIYN
jgi:hypothetical protein